MLLQNHQSWQQQVLLPGKRFLSQKFNIKFKKSSTSWRQFQSQIVIDLSFVVQVMVLIILQFILCIHVGRRNERKFLSEAKLTKISQKHFESLENLPTVSFIHNFLLSTASKTEKFLASTVK